jgi:hypothetical protein
MMDGFLEDTSMRQPRREQYDPESTSSNDNSSSHRWLDGGSSYEDVRVDFNVLSVVAMTLALIMIVELVRHYLDDLATHRSFFKAVLECLYAECKKKESLEVR